MESIVLEKDSNLLKLPELLYGTIKRVGMINKEPILYGDVNMLKLNDLYYILGAKLVYRLIKIEISNNQDDQDDQGGGGDVIKKGPLSKGSSSSILYTFDTIKQTNSLEGLLIPEEERGKIRNAGYLFNEIIYSGDANLVDNGSLFYHDTLPFISVVSNVDGTINLSTKAIIDGDAETIVTEYKVSPGPHDYSKDYLTLEALENGTFTFTVPANNYGGTLDVTSFGYSLDNGETWTTTARASSSSTSLTTPEVKAGEKVLWKGIANTYYYNGGPGIYSGFSSTCKFNVLGNLLSMCYGDEFEGQTESKVLVGMFLYSNVVSAKNLSLPATTLVDDCYYKMFNHCSLLIKVPTELPATTLANYCYSRMFANCTLITEIPKMDITTAANNCCKEMFYSCSSLTQINIQLKDVYNYCYQLMFQNCTSLTSVSYNLLPATTLASGCYASMFSGCTSLTTAPELPATILPIYCYEQMFINCSSLNYIKMLATDISANKCLYNWVANVSETGTFIKNKDAEWDITGNNGVPSGWTVETASS